MKVAVVCLTLLVVAASEGEGASEPEAEVPEASDCPDGMVLIPGGTFMMGSNDGDSRERPPHSVTVDEFCMDETEVTVDAYARCNGCSEPGTGNPCNWGESGKGTHPINCVDWHQATQYCETMGERLPTEEEWEYAARGGGSAVGVPVGFGRACWPCLLEPIGTDGRYVCCGELSCVCLWVEGHGRKRVGVDLFELLGRPKQ